MEAPVFESMLGLLGPTVVVLLFGGVALFLVSLVVVMVACFLGLGTELCRSISGWLLHRHQ
jgi:hypothetical protein